MKAQANITNKAEENFVKPFVAFSTKSNEHLLNLAIEVANISLSATQPDDALGYDIYEGEEKDYDEEKTYDVEEKVNIVVQGTS